MALGGNALLKRAEAADAEAQQASVNLAAEGLARIAEEHELVITHGDGAQMEPLALALRNELPDRELVTVLTEVVVDADDPTPEPRAIVELRSLRKLIDDGAVLICAGGGGIPVTLNGAGAMHGVEAVVDKDLTASLLARRLDADMLVMLTDVDAVHLGWGEPGDAPLREATPAELRKCHFERGSMAPKVEAACRFVEATDRCAVIGDLRDVPALVRGEAGTRIAAALPGLSMA